MSDDTPRRRLLVVTDCSHGGTFHVATLLAAGLRDAFTVDVAGPFGGAAADLAGLTVHATALSYENLDRSSYAIDAAADLLDAARPDLILSVDGAELSSLLAVKTVARRRGIPYVIVVNLLSADVLERFAPYLEASKDALANAASVVFVSEASRQRCATLLPDIDLSAHVIPNSVPDAFFAPRKSAARGAIRRELGIESDALVILTTARIEERKGQALGIAALGRLKAEGGGGALRWLLAGRAEDWDRRKLEGAIKAADVAAQVDILGERADIGDLLDASDVFVLTSYAEGMPLCIIEAMARGVPVVASAIDGVVEQIDESCGILLPPPGSDPTSCVDALAEALDAVSKDRDRLAMMGAAAHQRAHETFHPTICIARYRALLASSPAGAPMPAAAGTKLRTGSDLDCSDRHVIWNHLEDGWAKCERDGIWTDGPVSTMRLRFAADVTRLRLRFCLTPFPRRRDRTTRVFANSTLVGTWQARPGHNWLNVAIDPSEIGRDVLLRFENPGAVRPCDIGMGDDWRQLALFVRRVEIDPASPPSAMARMVKWLRAGRGRA